MFDDNTSSVVACSAIGVGGYVMMTKWGDIESGIRNFPGSMSDDGVRFAPLF